jgi:hypothetical protein
MFAYQTNGQRAFNLKYLVRLVAIGSAYGCETIAVPVSGRRFPISGMSFESSSRIHIRKTHHTSMLRV